jgi:hypothetical protein
MHQASDEERKS